MRRGAIHKISGPGLRRMPPGPGFLVSRGWVEVILAGEHHRNHGWRALNSTSKAEETV